MMFVTTGTDYHPFDRLVKEVDLLKIKGAIQDKVFIQSGSSLYKPHSCLWVEFLSFQEMVEKIKEAEIIITHAGPGSVMFVIYNGKVPIVVPRRKKYKEAVDDHQIYFSQKLEKEGRIILVEEIKDLEHKIKNYGKLLGSLKQPSENKELKVHTLRYANSLDKICHNLLKHNKKL